jgi:hypothetical protein
VVFYILCFCAGRAPLGNTARDALPAAIAERLATGDVGH